MNDAMVTARMSRQKKDAAARTFEKLGITASEAINSLYDYVLENGSLPFGDQPRRARWLHSAEEWARAAAVVDALPRQSRFTAMSDDEIKAERACTRGLLADGAK